MISLMITPLISFGNLNGSIFKNDSCCIAPVVKKYIQPKIPSDVVEPGQTGEITVKCLIDDQGNLVGAKTVQSSHDKLEDAVMSALENWEFDAAVHMGEHRRSTIDVPFRFTVASR